MDFGILKDYLGGGSAEEWDLFCKGA